MEHGPSHKPGTANKQPHFETLSSCPMPHQQEIELVVWQHILPSILCLPLNPWYISIPSIRSSYILRS